MAGLGLVVSVDTATAGTWPAPWASRSGCRFHPGGLALALGPRRLPLVSDTAPLPPASAGRLRARLRANGGRTAQAAGGPGGAVTRQASHAGVLGPGDARAAGRPTGPGRRPLAGRAWTPTPSPSTRQAPAGSTVPLSDAGPGRGRWAAVAPAALSRSVPRAVAFPAIVRGAEDVDEEVAGTVGRHAGHCGTALGRSGGGHRAIAGPATQSWTGGAGGGGRPSHPGYCRGACRCWPSSTAIRWLRPRGGSPDRGAGRRHAPSLRVSQPGVAPSDALADQYQHP